MQLSGLPTYWHKGPVMYSHIRVRLGRKVVVDHFGWTFCHLQLLTFRVISCMWLSKVSLIIHSSHKEKFNRRTNITPSMKAIFSLFIITNENGTSIKAEIEKFYWMNKISNWLTKWWRRFVLKLLAIQIFNHIATDKDLNTLSKWQQGSKLAT